MALTKKQIEDKAEEIRRSMLKIREAARDVHAVCADEEEFKPLCDLSEMLYALSFRHEEHLALKTLKAK